MDSEQIKTLALSLGADVVGIADLALVADLPTIPANLLAGYSRAVSIGVRLSGAVLDQIEREPTPLYAHHYLVVNQLLNTIALKVATALEQAGAQALPIPASQTLDQAEQYAHISSKAIARAAGLGWQGKSLLIINPDFGPRFRIATILTNAALTPDQPLANGCGACHACADACPAGAIRNLTFTDYPPSRDAALDVQKCAGKLYNEFARLPFVGDAVCGVCVKVCPWGQQGK